MEIKILGPGCAKCKVTEKQVKRAVKELGKEGITITKVENIQEIMKYNILNTPVLVIDEEIKVVGRIPSAKEIKKFILES